MVIAAMFAASVLLVAQPVSETPAPAAGAAVPAPTAPKAAVKPADDPDKVVCVSTEVTGSRFPVKQCHTRRQWAQATRDSQDLLNDATTHHETQSQFAGH
jgi:hypothetical protein